MRSRSKARNKLLIVEFLDASQAFSKLPGATQPFARYGSR
jgi:hypothetical protein